MPLEQNIAPDLSAEITQLEKELPKLNRPDYIRKTLSCAAAILLTLLVLEGLARFLVSVGTPYEGPTLEYDRSYALAIRPCPPDKQLVVCIGGSFTKRALYPELIEQRLKAAGINAELRNLSTVACSSQEQLSLVKAATEHAKRPVLVISDVRPLAFESHYLHTTIDYEQVRFDESYIGHRTTYGEKSDLISKVQDFAERNCYLLGYRTYLRYTLINWMALVFDSEKGRLARIGRADHQIGQSSHGWGPVFEIIDAKEMESGQKERKRVVAELKDLLGAPPYKWTYGYTEPITSFCTQQNLPLLYVWEPVHKSMDEVYASVGAPLSQFKSLFDRLPSRSPNTWFIDLHDCDLNDNDFKNMDHVNFEGAKTFSETLAQRLLQPPFVNFFKKSADNVSAPTGSVATKSSSGEL